MGLFLAILLNLIFTSPEARAFSVADCGEPPVEWQEYLRLDQDHNVPGRAVMTAEEKATQLVYRFQPPSSVEITAEHSARKQISEPHPPVYVAESWIKSEVEKKLLPALGPATAILCGRKVTSQNTVFVWDPTGKEPPFFVKLGHEETPSLGDLFERALKRSQVPGIRYMPETESVRAKVSPKKSVLGFRVGSDTAFFESTRREAIAVPGKPDPKRSLLPLHGSLGSPKIEEFAKKLGMSRDEWIRKVYLPTMADFFSKLHFQVGFHQVSHTQNLLLEINQDTGAIESVVIRDLRDMLPDYFKLLTEGKFRVPHEIYRRKRINAYHSDSGLTGFSEFEQSLAGVHFGRYSIQSISSFEKDPVKQMEYAEIFLKEYIAKAEAFLGKRLALSEEAKKALRWLERRDPQAAFLHSNYGEKQGYRHAAVTEVIQSVYDTVATERAAVVEIDADPSIQKELRTRFRRGHPAFATSAAAQSKHMLTRLYPSDWAYACDGQRIYALDANRRVVGVTITAGDQWAKPLEGFINIRNPKLLCPHKFAKLAR